ncbi:SGNH/GDSL hydrolase family protein [Rhodopseudomonas sp. WA056]|uniref:SGNH/GDSL hydrolase family protein n=1 Tax=Rhodopseudomonas sp. WA056 TaxID=2269367 RepID=UPI0013E0BA4B|nr:SGNH/GDSL hydrolase family protein [Rhodopseudomonas sp. WA056]NEW89740.1 SGNH/GDSL hydrolase family protein [Rhodopseudomonas sp. WA056]
MRVSDRSKSAAAALLATTFVLFAAPDERAQAQTVQTQTVEAQTVQAQTAQTQAGPAAGEAAPGEAEPHIVPADRSKTVAGTALDKIKGVAKQAGDILGRVPCLPPKGGAKSIGSLPRVARKLADRRPVVIVAFGSSSTQGYGSSSPAFTYPNRLAAMLRRHYPHSDITVVNSGKGGEDAPEMMQRLKTTVLDAQPDLVIWQVGTNAILRDLDPADTGRLVDDGIRAIQSAGADIVLVDPQYAPRVNERPEHAGKMIKALGRLAELRHVGIFPRFEVMKEWHEQQAIPFDKFVIADGLHMNDWGYACFAQLLGDGIIRSVDQVRLGTAGPGDVTAFRPM